MFGSLLDNVISFFKQQPVPSNIALRNRMKNTISKTQTTCHYYKPHIVSLKSSQLLNYLNHITSFKEKLDILEFHNSMLINVSKLLYMHFSPTMIYCFNNEIHLVFNYNDNGNFLYGGNIQKLISAVCSYASIQMNKALFKHNINLDFVYVAQYAEFDEDYETLNYIIWRQYDCKRNNTTLLYKCAQSNVNNVNVDSLKLSIMQKEMGDIHIPLSFIFGNIIKKQLVSPKDNYTRKHLCIEHFDLSLDFSVNLRKYIYKEVI